MQGHVLPWLVFALHTSRCAGVASVETAEHRGPSGNSLIHNMANDESSSLASPFDTPRTPSSFIQQRSWAGGAVNVTVSAAGSYSPTGNPNVTKEKSVFISSWALVAMLASYDGPLRHNEFPWLAKGLQHAVADSIGVCRAAVSVSDMRAVHLDFVYNAAPYMEESKRHKHKHHHDQGDKVTTSLLHRFEMLVRRTPHRMVRPLGHLNMTQVKVVYEARIFDEMRLPASEVARRIDSLQIYSKFSDFNRLLIRQLESTRGTSKLSAYDSVMLDDIGYASRHELPRPVISEENLDDCIEECLLHDARINHQYVVAISLVLVVLITCIGSAVFTIKRPSIVPSRLNPLTAVAPP